MSKVQELREMVERCSHKKETDTIYFSLAFLRLLLTECSEVEHLAHVTENMEKATLRAAEAERQVVQLRSQLRIAERAAGLMAIVASDDETLPGA